MTNCFFMLLMLPMGVACAGDSIKGGELYAKHCAECHGESGISVMPGTPNFAENESLIKPDSLLLQTITNGDKAMPSYLGILQELEMLDVIAFIRTLN